MANCLDKGECGVVFSTPEQHTKKKEFESSTVKLINNYFSSVAPRGRIVQLTSSFGNRFHDGNGESIRVSRENYVVYQRKKSRNIGDDFFRQRL